MRRSLIPFALSLAALFVGSALPRPAHSSAAPATPTFELTWGNFGSAPGQFNRPFGVATDAAGNVYVAEALNQRIQKFDALGNFITQWGSLGTGNGQFNRPIGVAVDAAGNVYVADRLNIRIQKFDSFGNFITKWGSDGSGHGLFGGQVFSLAVGGGFVYVEDDSNSLIQKFDTAGNFVSQWSVSLSGPGGVATDPAGNVYLAEQTINRVQKFDPNGNLLTQWGSTGSGNGQFSGLDAIATDAVGNVYVVDSANSRVQKFASDGTYLAQWGSLGDGSGQFRWDFGPAGIAVNAAGDVYVTNWTNDNAVHRVQMFSGAGAALSQAAPSYLLQWGSIGSGNGQFNGPSGAATDPAGNVYVTDFSNNRVQKFTSTGTYITQWGSAGSGNGQFNGPNSAATDAAGNVYVADVNNNRVQKFTSTGAYVTQWGSFGFGNGQFSRPRGVATDAAGNVYVTDNGIFRVQKFTSTGTYITQWGSTGSGNGQFNIPIGVATDAAGNVYVADRSNNRVQKFTSTGTYITQWGSLGSGNGQFTNPYGVATDAVGNVYVTDLDGNRVQKFTSNGAYLDQWGSLGSGTSQFNSPNGVATDATGNVYVTDNINNRVQKFVQPPMIALVSDVGNDQGRQARLRILRSSADSPGAGATITGYGIYRRVDPYPGATGASPAGVDARAGAPVERTGALLAGWEQVGTIAARGDAEYDVVVPTVANATAGTTFYTNFFVSAMTSDPLTYFDSGTEYGYSIDNLSPAAPASFTAAYLASATHLHWGVSTASDFATFRLYRGSSAGFVPGAGNLVAATTDTGFVDAGAAGSYYKLTAVDLNGNESPFAILGPGQTTAVAVGALRVFALEPARPNPTSGRRLIASFALPVAEAARLELIDVAGRRVAARDVGALGAGMHSVDLAEGVRIRPGLYFMRLSQGANEQVRRVTVIEP